MSTQNPTKLDMTHLLTRRLKATDVPKMMPIESVSFGKYYWSEEAFLNEMKNSVGRYYVTVNQAPELEEEQLVGYFGYWCVVDEGHITTIAVDPALRGNSLGEAQLILMLDKMIGSSIKYATLEVRVGNFAAQQMYYKYDFKCEGIRPKYYQDNNEDALIMTTPDMLTDAFRATFNKNRTKLIEKLGTLPRLQG